jgi:RNA-directed DNA polymerase
MPVGLYDKFYVFDPKRRLIHAACFKDRIFHHGIMKYCAPVLERAMTPSTFACLPGRGTVAAAKQVQRCLQRYSWYVKIDIQKYFDSIDHALLFSLLQRRFKGKELLEAVEKIIHSYHTASGKGLPIGSLTSQHFANYYLDGFDRYLLEHLRVNGHVRYMDDIIWWCTCRHEAKETLSRALRYLEEDRLLSLSKPPQINRSDRGVSFCGFRILPGALKLGRRRCLRYTLRRIDWENEYTAGRINERKLQAAYASVRAITANADSREWRRENLRRFPSSVIM